MRMIAKKITWLLLTLCTLGGAVWGQLPLLAALGLLLLLIPAVCAAVHLFVREKMKISIKMPANLQKGAQKAAVLQVTSRHGLPLGRISARLTAENLLTGETQTQRLFAPLGAKTEFTVGSAYCGRISVQAEELRLYDCFGVLGVAYKKPVCAYMTVQPETFAQTIVLTPAAENERESEQYSQEKPGFDRSEVFQLREYIPGDAYKQIHWKLSQKLDRLIVKDASLPILRSAAVFWERTEENPAPERTDAQAEVAATCCKTLLSQAAAFTVIWNDAEQERLICQRIENMDDFAALLPRLMMARCAKGVSGAELLLQSGLLGEFSHLLCISARSDAAALCEQRRCCLLNCAGESGAAGIAFDTKNYAAKTAELVL